MRRAALLFTVVLCAILSNRVAGAFDCTGLKPSSIVVCSDPELMRLADERQEAINQARERIGEEAWPVLWENQQTWVRSYAPTCGIPQDRPPPMPVPASIRACFKRAAESRIAFIRGYGLPATGSPPAVAQRVGPGFDCSKAVRPLALLICADADLAEVDLRFNQAYWALYQQLDSSSRQGLLQEDVAFIDAVQDQCGIPRSGGLPAQASRAKYCIRGSYEGQRVRWLFRLSAPAYEEATRQAERHLALQQALQTLGFLSSAKLTDGVYGEQTRDAIIAWQMARGRAPTGLLGEDDARALEGEAPRRPALFPAPAASLPSQRDEVALTPQDGIFRVPARINDAITLSFVIDSGASDVQIPADVAMTLARAGTISQEDFVGSQTYTLADGSELSGDQFKLRELRLGNHIVRNVLASIGPVKGNLLLGQSFLSRFGTWAIDNTRHALILGSSNGDQRAQRSGD